MRTFRLVVAYDGTLFHGWQEQPGLRTVQGVLQEAVEDLMGEKVQIAGAGRTDAGVHARGQTASFEANPPLPARALMPLLNRALPGDVRVRSAVEESSGFHARHSAEARRYAYRLMREDDLLQSRFAWWPRAGLDADALERATRPLEGEADMSAFRGAGSSPANPVCRVLRAGWSREGALLRFDVVADHFLYHMVRNIVGTAVAVARGRDPGAAFEAVIRSRDRRRAGITAPPEGLCLEQVFYRGEAG